jgi:hypothetical protein
MSRLELAIGLFAVLSAYACRNTEAAEREAFARHADALRPGFQELARALTALSDAERQFRERSDPGRGLAAMAMLRVACIDVADQCTHLTLAMSRLRAEPDLTEDTRRGIEIQAGGIHDFGMLFGDPQIEDLADCVAMADPMSDLARSFVRDSAARGVTLPDVPDFGPDAPTGQ